MSAAASLRVALVVFALAPELLRGQDLFTALGGVHAPQIRVTMNAGAVDLEATHQGFIRRAVSQYEFDHTGGYGYGYESIHFTFGSRARMDLPQRRRAVLLLDFYNASDGLICRSRILREAITTDYSRSSALAPHSYQIDLIGVPLALIDEVRRVDVVVVE